MYEGLTNWANETLWVNKHYFSKAHNLKWQILLLSELGAWGWMGNQPGFWLVFFWCSCLLVCNSQTHKIHNVEPSVMDLKIRFCLHQCAKKRDKYICNVPPCHIWNIWNYQLKPAWCWPSSLLVPVPLFAPDDVCALFKQETPPVLQDRLYLVKRSNDNLFSL